MPTFDGVRSFALFRVRFLTLSAVIPLSFRLDMDGPSESGNALAGFGNSPESLEVG